ncbi:MAG: hypothetical protein K2K90_02635 [Lachnospiraceae bacterium]|nr:hypothetical protein [Lachnospiraceae bacterium]
MGGEPLFFGDFDTADNVAIDAIWQNLGLLPKGLVLPNCMGFAEKYRGFAKRYAKFVVCGILNMKK